MSLKSHPFTLLSLLAAIPSLHAAPIITEFLASNQTGLMDEDLTRPDWIEIYNPDAAPVDLGGYHLTDDVLLPQKWTFPPGVVLNPGSYLVVFASGKDRTVAGANLHTNFQISAGGEYLALTAPGGTPALSEWNPFPVQSGDVSYGLLTPVAGGTGSYFNVPTPGAVNDGAAAPADPVNFSITSRTFNQGGTLSLSLSSPSSTATIRYTQNRSRPIGVDGTVAVVTANATTDTFTSTAAHGFTERDFVQLDSSSSSFPGGIGQSLNYYVIVTGATTFKLSETAGGTPVDVTSAGGGTLTVRRDAVQVSAVTTTTSSFTANYHPFNDRDDVTVAAAPGGTLPSGLVAGNTYYVVIPITTPVNRLSFALSATPGGSAITGMAAGTGNMIIRRKPSPVYSAPLTLNYSQQVRARGFETGRPYGPIRSEGYLMLDAAAQSFTSNIPVMVLHSFGSGHPSGTAAGIGTPEDDKAAYWFVFEPKVEVVGQPAITRMTNLPDLAVPGHFERRGSSTFGATKYSMTMGALSEENDGREVTPLTGFATNDDFVLNAPFEFDRSLMHNDLIYRLSNEAGRYAVNTRHVEVFMSVNNDIAAAGGLPAYGVVRGAYTGVNSEDYYGVYSFQDKIRRGDGLVDVEKLTPQDNTAPNVQGGYIFKIDRRDPGDYGLAGAGRTAAAVPPAVPPTGTTGFSFVQPKEFTSYPSHLPVVTPAQSAYLTNTLNAMQTALNGPNYMSPTLGYAAHLDVPACIDHWWFSVLPKSADAFRLSGYWHKSRFGKLAMGPIFDFDRAMGSTDGRDLNPVTWRGDTGDLGTDYFHSAGIFSPNYFERMFADPNFWQSMIDRYHSLRTGVLSTAHVHAIVDEWTELLDPGNSAVNTSLVTPAKRNFQKFPGQGPRPANASTPGTDGTFRGEAQWLKNWWGKAGTVTANGRFDFVDSQFTRPATANFASGPVPVGSSVTLTSPSVASHSAKIYYTTNGTDPRPVATGPIPPVGSYVTIGTLLPEINTVRAIVPSSSATGGTANEWRGADLNANNDNWDDFNDSTWYTNAPGTLNAVGYDDQFPGPPSNVAGSTDYQPYFTIRWNTATYQTGGTAVTPAPVSPAGINSVMRSGTVGGTSYTGNQTCYVRIPFDLSAAQMAQVVAGNRITLQIRVDDGFVAWLNGSELTTARLNAPATSALAFNSPATTTNADGNAITYADHDITAVALTALHEGNNILAIHGLNSGTGSSDFLIGAKIVVQSPPPPYEADRSPAATEYTGPLNITEPTQLFVRTLINQRPSDPPTASGGGVGVVPVGSSWSGPTVLYYFPGAAVASQANIQISEVFYHPSPPTADEITAGFTNSNDFEFIRLTNTGSAPVDLTGIYFSNGLEFTAAPGLQNWLPAGQSVVVVENTAAFISRYGSSFTILGEFNGELDDGGEHIVLNDKTGAVISDFIYGDGTGPGDNWPTAPDDGYSLLYVGGDQNLPASWRVSRDPGGSAVNTFARWQTRYFASGDIHSQGMAADSDGDGLNNLGEYAFGTDPRSAGTAEHSIALAVSGQAGRLSLRRRTGTTDLTWIIEATTDLAGAWNAIGGAPLSTMNNGDDTETLLYEAPGAPAGARTFIRARVTNP